MKVTSLGSGNVSRINKRGVAMERREGFSEMKEKTACRGSKGWNDRCKERQQ